MMANCSAIICAEQGQESQGNCLLIWIFYVKQKKKKKKSDEPIFVWSYVGP